MKHTLNVAFVFIFFLTACSANATTPLAFTETPFSVKATSTETPTSSPTETPLLPIESLPITKQSVGDFASAMQNVGINITAEQILQQGLQIQTITGKDGNQYEVATTYLDLNSTQQGETLKGDYPLMVKGMDGKWSSNLRQLAILANMKIGTSIAKSETIPQITETDLMNIQSNEFNSGLLSLYWAGMEKNQGTVDYTMRINSAEFAKSNNMDTIGHLVLWGKDVPLWLKNGNFSRDRLIEIMKERVRNTITTMTKYGVTSYIVVNEAGSGNDIFNNNIGQEYIEIAFQVARDTGKELKYPFDIDI